MARAKRSKTKRTTRKATIGRKAPISTATTVSQLPRLLFIVTFTIVIGLILSLIFKQKTGNNQGIQPSPTGYEQSQGDQTSPQVMPSKQQMQEVDNPVRIGSSYTVQKGDTLWSIAQRAYGSGFNAYDIAKRNNLDNPSAIEVGQRLILPNTQAKTPTQGEIASGISTQRSDSNTASGTYTIVRGDCLWTIAQKRYNDGYRWGEIARANHLENPSLIHAGNTLILP